MQKLIADVDAKFGAVKDSRPAVRRHEGAAAGRHAAARRRAGERPASWRHEFLTGIGLTVVDTDEALIPREKMATVLDSADVLIWTTESDEEQAALLADPTIAGLSATTDQRNVFTGKELAGAIAYASTLSYPVVAETAAVDDRRGAGLI